MNTGHFTDKRIEEISIGKVPMTTEEFEFLCTDTPSFEECYYTEDQLRQMSHKDLMNVAYWTWADYVKAA